MSLRHIFTISAASLIAFGSTVAAGPNSMGSRERIGPAPQIETIAETGGARQTRQRAERSGSNAGAAAAAAGLAAGAVALGAAGAANNCRYGGCGYGNGRRAANGGYGYEGRSAYGGYRHGRPYGYRPYYPEAGYGYGYRGGPYPTGPYGDR